VEETLAADVEDAEEECEAVLAAGACAELAAASPAVKSIPEMSETL
jgi:hypothetical protein